MSESAACEKKRNIFIRILCFISSFQGRNSRPGLGCFSEPSAHSFLDSRPSTGSEWVPRTEVQTTYLFVLGSEVDQFTHTFPRVEIRWTVSPCHKVGLVSAAPMISKMGGQEVLQTAATYRSAALWLAIAALRAAWNCSTALAAASRISYQ